MRYIMRKICLFPVMIAVIVFTGCGQKKNEDPVTVHYGMYMADRQNRH